MNPGDIVTHSTTPMLSAAIAGTVSPIYRVIKVQGNMMLMEGLNESGTYNFFQGKVDEYHKVV